MFTFARWKGRRLPGPEFYDWLSADARVKGALGSIGAEMVPRGGPIETMVFARGNWATLGKGARFLSDQRQQRPP